MPFDKANLRSLPLVEQPAHGGVGSIRMARVADRSDFAGGCNFVDYAVVPPGVSIGEHRHAPEEEELYLVLSGTALVSRGSELIPVRAGDLVRNPPGQLHGLRNEGSEEVELFVFELEVRGCEPPP
jgi:mannose-6-phosphate isomerase-like protein (cupin superfamily)